MINAVDEEGKVDLNGVQNSTLLTFGVKGQQELTVKGPRLNGTKKEKTSIVYGIDYRLSPRVLPSVPMLQVRYLITFTTASYLVLPRSSVFLDNSFDFFTMPFFLLRYMVRIAECYDALLCRGSL